MSFTTFAYVIAMGRGKIGIAPAILFLALLVCPSGNAQITNQFWPELDASFKISPSTQFFSLVKDTREGGQTTQLEIGSGFQLSFKPLIRLRDLSEFPSDQARSRILTIAVGYRYLPEIRSPAESRIRMDATSLFPVKLGLVMADRNVMILQFVSGEFNWIYRNRLAVQRRLFVHSHAVTPYVSCESYYGSASHKWYDTALDAGTKLELSKKMEIDLYYEHQNETNEAPNQQVNSVGLTLNVFFLRGAIPAK